MEHNELKPELKPCPFCGCRLVYDDQYIRDGREITCSGCGAGVHAFQPNANDKAIFLWNRRAADPTKQALVEELTALLDDIDGAEADGVPVSKVWRARSRAALDLARK